MGKGEIGIVEEGRDEMVTDERGRVGMGRG